jgi:hypothetical protein
LTFDHVAAFRIFPTLTVGAVDYFALMNYVKCPKLPSLLADCYLIVLL